jgi:hypothetical protein
MLTQQIFRFLIIFFPFGQNLKVEVEEREGLLNLIDEAEGWLNTKLEEQEHKLPHEVHSVHLSSSA